MTMSTPVFLDHFQTEQFGLYWRHYPEIGLNAGLFCNLVLYGAARMDPESFYPDDVRRSRWSDAYQDFLGLQIVDFVREVDRLDRATSAIFGSRALSGLNLPDFQDVFYYDYCARSRVPFCISRRRTQDIGRIVALADEVFGRRNDTSVEGPGHRAAVAEWLFDLEIPALRVRNERLRHELFVNRPHLVARKPDGASDDDFTRLLLASKWYELQETWFISPEELVQAFKGPAIGEVRAKVLELAARVATRAELDDAVSSERETLDRRVGVSDWMFTGVNLAFCWAPFSGAATAPAQVAANRVIRRPFEWLLFMSSLNRSVREASTRTPTDRHEA